VIHAKDEAGKDFWVWSGTCVIGEGGKIEVLAGDHFDKMESKVLKRSMQDCYVATRIRANGKEVNAMPAHGLPDGCIVVR
jgi:hypothetical protein